MKYSSPLIPDGSITTVKLSDGAVTRAKIAASTTGQSGIITTLGSASIVMTNWSLFPDIETDMPVSASVHLNVVAGFDATPTADADTPTFWIHNEDSVTRGYDMAWRTINA